MNGRLDGKVSLITGTASGMGRAAALKFAQEGALVIGCDLNEAGNDETIRLVEAAGFTMTGMAPVDLSDPEVAKSWVEESAAIHGRIDVVFNNASGPRFAPLPDMSVDLWQFNTRNELDLVFYVTKFAWPYLAERGGVFVNTGSTSAWEGTPHAGMAAHCAHKGGVVAFTRAVADRWRGCRHPRRQHQPGTDQNSRNREELLLEGSERRGICSCSKLLSKRIGVPEDVASLAAFVASDEAAYMTGCDVIIDGGLTCI